MLRFVPKNPASAGYLILNAFTLPLFLFDFFSYCLVIKKTTSGGISEVCLASMRPSIHHFYDFTTNAWGLVPNDHLVVSYPCFFVSLRLYGSPSFHIPRLYTLGDFNSLWVFVSRSFDTTVMPQEGVEVYGRSISTNKLVPWEKSDISFEASTCLGIATPTPAYSKRLHLPGSSLSEQEVLVLERSFAGHFYSTAVDKQFLPNMGNILPVPSYELVDENSLFFDPQLRYIWKVCSKRIFVLIEFFLKKSVKALIVLFTGGVDTPGYLYYKVDLTLQHQLDEAALSLTFTLLAKMGFLRSADVALLELKFNVELGLNIRPAPLPAISYDLSKEILYIEKELTTDLIPGLVNGLSSKELNAMLISKKRASVTQAMATLICREVWLSWQQYFKGPTRFE